MPEKKYFIIDFDSTFTRVEALDVLGGISLADDPDRDDKLMRIKEITDGGMDGGVPFSRSLEQRIALLGAHRDHLPVLVERLKSEVSVSFRRNAAFLRDHSGGIYIVSSGFREFIEPVVQPFGIRPDHVFANTFEYDGEGNITGFDRDNVLSTDNGKVEQVRALGLDGEVIVVGDGWTDYQIREAGLADRFFAFTENVSRAPVVAKADHVAPSLDEVCYETRIDAALSYPKNRIRVLLLENIHPDAAAIFRDEGYRVDVHPAAMSEDELTERIGDVSILGIRSKTRITERVMEKAGRLIAVGAFCIGTNQVDLRACLARGTIVFNAPFSNTRSVVELAVAEIIMLSRRVADNTRSMHDGVWHKSAEGCHEVRGKTLGIVGYGNIGSQLSVIAENLGMEVVYFDLEEKLALGNARKAASLDALLKRADFVTLHVDGRPENDRFFGVRQFAAMKKGAVFLNLSRGNVVDIAALREAVETGRVRGAAVDVFPREPGSNREPFESELRGLPNVILTSHIGGSTREAQENIADYVPQQIIRYVNTGSSMNSVNFPALRLPELTDAHRMIHVHKNVPGVLAEINKVFAANRINIVGQYLKTNETVGYVITDIETDHGKKIVRDLRKIPHTIRVRVLY